MADGIRFKTGYVASPISYSNLGREAGKSIGDSLRVIEQERQRRSALTDQQFGFSKTAQELVPSAINERYRSGAQMLLNNLQSTAAQAKLAPTQENLSAFQIAKQEYNDFKNLAVSVSSMNNQTVANIRKNAVRGMVGTSEENLALFNQYNTIPQYSLVNGRLTVMQDGQPVAWRDSNIGDINDVFVPQIQAPETEYASNTLSDSLYSSKFSAEVDSYQQASARGFFTGQINEELLNANVTQSINNKIATRPDALKTIAYEAHKRNNLPMQDQLTTEDLDDALVAYNPAAHAIKVGGKAISSGSLNAQGQFVFDVSDEDLANSDLSAEEKQQADMWRVAVGQYYEEVGLNIRNRMPKKDQTAAEQRFVLQQQKADERDAARTQAALDKATQEAQEDAAEARLEAEGEVREQLATAPGLQRSEEGYVMAVGNATDYTIPGPEGNIVVTKVKYNDSGAVTGYEIKDVGQDITEILLNEEYTEEEKNRRIQQAMAGTRSQTVDVTDDRFGDITNSLKNKDVATSRQPPRTLDELAARKIRAHQEGQIGDGVLGGRGMGTVSFDEEGNVVIGGDSEIDLDEIYEQETAG
jgi:hypothetical protein